MAYNPQGEMNPRKVGPKANPMPQAGGAVSKSGPVKPGQPKPKTGGGLQSPPRPRANPMPGQGGGIDARSRINDLPGLNPMEREKLVRAANRGAGSLRDAVAGQPFEQDVMQAFAGAAGAAQNKMGGARPASGGGVPGVTSGDISMEGQPAQGPLDSAYATSAIEPMQGAPGQPGSDTSAPPAGTQTPPIVPQPMPGGGGAAGGGTGPVGLPPSGVPLGGITSVWNPQAREKMAAERGWGFVQQVQDAMNAATANLPQGTGARQQAIYGVLQQFGLAGGQGVPQGQPPGSGTTRTPPIMPQGPNPTQAPPVTQTPPIYIPPQSEPAPPVQVPDIFLPF